MDLDRIEDLQDVGPDWSISRLQTILQCGRKYRFKYVDKVEEPPTPPLAFGSAIHKCIETMHFKDVWDERDLQRMWSDEWYEAQSKIDWDNTNYRKHTFDGKGINILVNYANKHSGDEWLAIEAHFRYAPGYGLPILRGTFDKVQRLTRHEDVPDDLVGRLAIVDYKTGKNPPDQLLVSVDPQLSFYYSAFQDMFGERPVLGLHHLLTDTIYWTERSPNAVAEAYTMLGEGKDRVDDEKFERNIAYHCKWCPYREECLGAIK